MMVTACPQVEMHVGVYRAEKAVCSVVSLTRSLEAREQTYKSDTTEGDAGRIYPGGARNGRNGNETR